MSNEGFLKEYESLRTEQLQSDRICLELLTFTLSITGVIMGLGVNSLNAYLFLIPLPVLWLAYRYVIDKRWGIFIIASYIRCRLENEQTGLWWETSVNKVRKNKNYHLNACNVIVVEFWMITLTGIALLVLFQYFSKLSDYHWFRGTVTILYLISLACLVVPYRQLRCRALRDMLDGLWEQR